MNRNIVIGVLILLLAGCAGVPQVDRGEAQVYLAQILSESPDSPRNQGLLELALQASREAQKEAGLAVGSASNLAMLKSSALKIRAIVGPGENRYSVIQATSEIVQLLRLASKSSDASIALKSEVVRLGRSAKSILVRARSISRLASEIAMVSNAAQAQVRLEKIGKLALELESGLDRDGDGLVTWRRGEGGLSLMQDRLRSVYIPN